MTICSLLIHVLPACAEQARAQLEQLPGVEVHAATAEGLLIVTVEAGDDPEMNRTFEQLRAIPGVHATTLVYHHSERLEDESPAQGESTL
ncbi:MAG: chaperone NapD [Acidobacteria bacterium]|nr:chaperone NapD [Acidobacteriota bacterium]